MGLNGPPPRAMGPLIKLRVLSSDVEAVSFLSLPLPIFFSASASASFHFMLSASASMINSRFRFQLPLPYHWFLVATKRLYMRVCPSVRRMVGNLLFFRPTRSDLCRVYGLVKLLFLKVNSRNFD